MSADLAGLVARLEAVAGRLESATVRAAPASSGAAPSAAAPVSSGGAGNASLDGYDELLNGSFASFVSQGKALGGELAQQIAMVERAFKAQRAFIEVAAKSKKPAQSALPALLKDTSEAIGEITSFRESNRRSPQFNHLSAISEGIPALGWVTMEPKPAPFVKEMKDAAQFYTNRVLKDSRESDPKQAEWAKSWIAVLEDLAAYIKKVHTTGLVWNPNGGEASAPASTPAAASSGGPPPPPPGPAPTITADDDNKKSSASDARAGLFAELSKGSAITSGLKKVDKSQMTHKNPELRGSSVVPAKTASAAPKKTSAAPKFGAAAKPKTPVFELNGKKWVIEHQKDNKSIVIDDCNIKQTVYIYKCEGSTIQIKGKVNGITLDGCKKTAVVFDNCVASFEMVNCQSCQVQVTGAVPTVAIEKTDGAQVYLSKESIECQIITAKSSEMNVLLPVGEDGEFKEFALPEQFKSSFDGTKMQTEMTDIAA